MAQAAFEDQKKSVTGEWLKEKLFRNSDYHAYLTWALIGANLFKPSPKQMEQLKKELAQAKQAMETYLKNRILILPVYHCAAPLHGQVYKEIFSIRKTYLKYLPYVALALLCVASCVRDQLPRLLELLSGRQQFAQLRCVPAVRDGSTWVVGAHRTAAARGRDVVDRLRRRSFRMARSRRRTRPCRRRGAGRRRSSRAGAAARSPAAAALPGPGDADQSPASSNASSYNAASPARRADSTAATLAGRGSAQHDGRGGFRVRISVQDASPVGRTDRRAAASVSAAPTSG